MNRRTLFGNLLAAGAAFVVAPAVGQAEAACADCDMCREYGTLTVEHPVDGNVIAEARAEAACAECEALLSNPVPLPEMYAHDPERERALIEMAHVTALREGVSHRTAAVLLWPQFLPSLVTVPEAAAESTAQDSDPGWLVWHADGSKEPVRTITLTETDPLRSETEFYVNRGPGKVHFLYTKNGAPVQDPEYNRKLGGGPFDFEQA